jgi:hypothetical protein
MGIPGCPEFAFWTASAAKSLIVLIQSWSNLLLKTRLLFYQYFTGFVLYFFKAGINY